MDVEEYYSNIVNLANDFGMKPANDSNPDSGNVIVRKNIGKDNKEEENNKNVPYFGFIRPGEAKAGTYKDISLVFFPSDDGSQYLMTLVVGTDGFKEDTDLASQPGLRRLFIKLLPNEEEYASFAKVDFTDISNSPKKDIFNKKIKKYENYLLIGCLIDPEKDEDLVKAWIAQYAEVRGWTTNDKFRKAAGRAIDKYRNYLVSKTTKCDIDEIEKLLRKRQFVVLQGAPGTGKTYMAEQIAKKWGCQTEMIQFHAETSYSDFVEGLMPDLNDKASLKYVKTEGKLVEALHKAEENKGDVILIIDEINRANLANVLGPVFYLFEHTREKTEGNDGVELGGKKYNVIPQNLYVIATMNTADRSIAVVDFALRRRFAWYTMLPRFFNDPKIYTQSNALFNEVSRIFERYASDEELNLQPGGSYFLAKDGDDVAMSIEYELMPLIKEYLDQGLLQSAKHEFSELFFRHINKHLYR